MISFEEVKKYELVNEIINQIFTRASAAENFNVFGNINKQKE